MDLDSMREQFPILEKKINGHRLVYLDSAASSLKPKKVVDRICQHYLMEASNVHRGSHQLSDQATTDYEDARSTVRQFCNASCNEEIIFTRSATEALNLIASSFGSMGLQAEDEILVTEMEHHSNIVPWQILAQRMRCHVKFLPVDMYGCLDLSQVEKFLHRRTKIFALTWVSNTLGTENPLKELVTMGRDVGAKVVVDAAQALVHTQIDVQDLGCDFLVGSGHKIFGPTGIGFLFGRQELLEKMPPYQYGGGMIEGVTPQHTTYADLPHKFEAGTPHIAGAIGLAEALTFFQNFSRADFHQHEQKLLEQIKKGLQNIKGVRLIGQPEAKDLQRKSAVSFVVEGYHHQDIGQILNNYGIAVRTGHHCTQILMKRFGIEGTVRASVSLYNTNEDIALFLQALDKSIDLLKTA